MASEREYLKTKIIEFQLNIAKLNHLLAEQKDHFAEKEKKLYLGLFDILDAFENINKTIEEKRETFNKTTRMLSKNIQSIQKKLNRLIKSADIIPIDFPDNKAIMDYCKIIDTRNEPEIEDETILTVVKKGYIDKQQGRVIRKAEVITNRL